MEAYTPHSGQNFNRFGDLASTGSSNASPSPSPGIDPQETLDANYVTMDAEVSSIGIQPSQSESTTHDSSNGGGTAGGQANVNVTAPTVGSNESWYDRLSPGMQKTFEGIKMLQVDLSSSQLPKRMQIVAPGGLKVWKGTPIEILLKYYQYIASKFDLPSPFSEHIKDLWKQSKLSSWGELLDFDLKQSDDMAPMCYAMLTSGEKLQELVQLIGLGSNFVPKASYLLAIGIYLHRGLVNHFKSLSQHAAFGTIAMATYDPLNDASFQETVGTAQLIWEPIFADLQNGGTLLRTPFKRLQTYRCLHPLLSRYLVAIRLPCPPNRHLNRLP